MIQNISIEETKNLAETNKSNSDFVILDVRTKDEFDAGHIENAINLDVMLPDFTDKLNAFNKNKVYLVHCQRGARSARAVEIMKSLGFENIYNMEQGFGEWESKGYPISKLKIEK